MVKRKNSNNSETARAMKAGKVNENTSDDIDSEAAVAEQQVNSGRHDDQPKQQNFKERKTSKSANQQKNKRRKVAQMETVSSEAIENDELEAKAIEKHSSQVQFREEDNEIVMEVTCQQDSEFLSKESEDEESENDDDHYQEVMEMEDREFEEALAAGENNNTSADSSEEIKTLTKVPHKFRQQVEEGLINQKRQSLELESSKNEIRALKALIAKFEEILSGQKIWIRNPEFEVVDQQQGSKKQRLQHCGQEQVYNRRVTLTNKGKGHSPTSLRDKLSTATIYQQAIKPMKDRENSGNACLDRLQQGEGCGDDDSNHEIQFNFNRFSTSEEEGDNDGDVGMVNSSDEFVGLALDTPTPPVTLDDQSNRANANKCLIISDKFYDRQPKLGTSRIDRNRDQHRKNTNRYFMKPGYKSQGGGDSARRFDDGQDWMSQIIQDAEQSKAQMYETPGEKELSLPEGRIFNSIDDDYMTVVAHVDLAIEKKIAQGIYVDFAKLIPKDKVTQGDSDHRMELISKGGMTYFVPVSDRENQQIVNFHVWVKAFRVFSHIYMRYHPERTVELIEYNFMIHSASVTFTWDNVYAYNRDFRLHMERHPAQNWGLILQQASSFRLKDRVKSSYPQAETTNNATHTNKKQREPCYHFNKGRYTFGEHCKFDHQCIICGKFGHGAHNCRRGMGGN